MIRVMHVITGLETGGAEVMLCKLLAALDRGSLAPVVVSLRTKGALGRKIERLGVPVYSLDVKTGWSAIKGLWALVGLLRSVRPDLVQGWMYHGNLAAILACSVVRWRVPVLWNVRQAVYDITREKFATRLVIRAGALLSRVPQRIIYNSELAASQHRGLGYRDENNILIANGFDCQIFKPSAKARQRVRRVLGIDGGTRLVGMVTRYHPVKGCDIFLKAAGTLARDRSDVHFLLAGKGMDAENAVLAQMIKDNGLQDRVCLLGEVSNPQCLFPALDIAVSASHSESFSNAIGEAMACGVPLVVTDVGASARLLGRGGLVVPANDSAAMASSLTRLLEMYPDALRRLGESGRERIRAHFSLGEVAASYLRLYRESTASLRTRS